MIEVCRSPRVRPRVALVALAGLLLGQTLAPCGILLADVHAAELRLKTKAAAVKPANAPIPIWAKALEKRAAQEQRAQKLRLAQFRPAGKNDKGDGASPEDTECLDCEVDVESLDVSDVPTEKALRRAGGVDGALYPMRRAEPEELGLKLDRLLKRVGVEGGLRGQVPPKDPRFQSLKTAKERYSRAREINTLFGRAVKAWQQDERVQATRLFGQYMERYPKSPWSGEAYLHLGVAAKDDGQLIEAMEIFGAIVDKSSDKPNEKLREAKRERKKRGGAPLDSEREADISRALAGAATLEEAVVDLDSAEENDDDDESFEIHMKAKAQLADVDMLMGHYQAAQQKLSEIVRDDHNWRRRTGASSQWQRANFLSRNAGTLTACGPQALGLVLVSQGKDDDKARAAHAPRAQGFSLAELETLAHQNGVEMDGFQAEASELAKLPLPAILHYDFGPDSSAQGKAAPCASNGHFVVLQGVDEASRTVRVYDPLHERSERMSYAQLDKQWSGQGLILEKPRVRLAIAPLDADAMKRAVGGQSSALNRNVGDSDNNAAVGGGPGGPNVEINKFSMNQHIEQTLLSYQPSRGPSIDITLNFNSQDVLSQYQKFGRKWTFNYTTYAYESNGRLILIMPDGSRADYLPMASDPNRFVGLKGNFATVDKQSGGYVLRFQDGSSWYYTKRTGTVVSFLGNMQDSWGNSVSLFYDGNNRLTTIRDADGRETKLGYNADGLVETVRDPFGRVATFSYFNNHLYGCTDGEGQAFEYRYGGPLVSRMAKQQAGTTPLVWLYNQAGPNPNVGDASITVTATNPLSDSTSYRYNGSTYISSETDYKGNTTQYSFVVGPREELLNRTVYPASDNVTGVTAQEFNDLGLPRRVYHEVDGRRQAGEYGATEFTYNARGNVAATKDAQGNVTTFNYAPNGVDVTGVVNANNVQTVSASYVSQYPHQPASVTDLSTNGTTTFSYTPWGDVDTVIDPLNQGTRTLYGTAGNELGRPVAVQNSEAPSTPDGPRNWKTIASYTYDNVGRVATTTDNTTNLTVGYEYDGADRIKAVVYPDSTREETTYLNGLPVIFKDRAGRYSYTEYDDLGRAKRSYAQDAQNNAAVGTVAMDYDKNSNLTLLTDSNGKITRWDFNPRDQVARKTYQDNTYEAYTYHCGIQSTVRGTRGQVVTYAYYFNGLPKFINYPNTKDVAYFYNKLNDPIQINVGGEVERLPGYGYPDPDVTRLTYDDYGRLLSSDGPLSADTQTYAYDALQRIQTQTVEGGANGGVQSQTYAYDGLGRLASINSNGLVNVGQTTYAYEGDSDRLSELTHPNGTKTRQQYDSLGRLQRVFNGANGDPFYNRYASNYDARDLKINTQSRTGSGNTPYQTTFYTYDALDQLKQENVAGGVPGTAYTKTYNYDAMGNRTQVGHSGANLNSTTTSTPNDLNQLTSTSTVVSGGPTTNSSLSYDAAGNLAQVESNTGVRTVYTYDDADRLSRIEWFDVTTNRRTWKSEFEYDYASRRVLTRDYNYATSNAPTPQINVSVFDGLDVIQERHANNFLRAHIVRDGSVGGILSRFTAEGPAYYGYDGQGNVTLLTNSAGQDVGHYRYDAFGQTLEAAGPRASENPYRFSTKPIHERSGLYDFGYRFYSPGLGRWINRDPLGEEGGINLYAAMGNNAVNNVDEYGLTWRLPWHWFSDRVSDFLTPPKVVSNSDEPGADDLAAAQNVGIAKLDAQKKGAKSWIVGSQIVMAAAPLPGASAATRVRLPRFSGLGPRGYYRPSGVPKNWVAQPAQQGVGKTWVKPNTAVPGETYVRVMKGNPGSPWPNSRRPYVRMQKNGQPLDRNGNMLPSKHDSRAHIPRRGFKVNPRWFD